MLYFIVIFPDLYHPDWKTSCDHSAEAFLENERLWPNVDLLLAHPVRHQGLYIMFASLQQQ